MAQLLLCMKKSQLLDSLMDKRLSFPLKRCGFESSSISHFCLLSFQFASLFVFILDFAYTWIYIFESGIRLFDKYTRRNVNNFIYPKCINSLHAVSLILADFFHSKLFQKHLLGTLSECQTVFIQIRTHVLSVLIWKHTICKGYQQTTEVAADKKRVRKP